MDRVHQDQGGSLKEFAMSTALLFAAKIAAAFLGLLTTIIVARGFGSEAVGFVSLVTSGAILASTVSVFGLNTLVMRDLSASDLTQEAGAKAALFGQAAATAAVTTLGAAIVMMVFLSFRLPPFAAGAPVLALAIAGLAVFGRGLVAYCVNVSRAVVRPASYAFFVMVSALVNVLLVSAAWLAGVTSGLAPAMAVATGFCAAGLLAGGSIRARLSKGLAAAGEAPPRIRPRPGLLAMGTPFAISAIGGILLTEGNLVIGAVFLDYDELGIYAVAHRMALLSFFILSSIQMMAAPRFSRLWSAGEVDRLKRTGRDISRLAVLANLPVFALLILGRDPIIDLAFGSEFGGAAPVLAVLLVGQAVNALTGVTGPFLMMTGGQKTMATVSVVAGVVNIALVVLLTPIYGVLGPAIAMAIALSTQNLAAVTAIRLRHGFWLCYIPGTELLPRRKR
jgi:O-antigen/teichoic acid export membrane protein